MSVRHKVAIVTFLACLLYLPFRTIYEGMHPRLSFIAVGQGDAVLYQIQGNSLLVDCGPKTDSFDAGRRLLIPELKRLGVRTIDILVLTHADYDHIGGAESVAEVFTIKQIITTPEVYNDPRMTWLKTDFKGQLNLVEETGYAQMADLEIFVQAGTGSTDNDRSLAVLAKGVTSILLTSDLGAAQEQLLTQTWDEDVQFAKAGHHGSRSSNSTEWLTHFKPDYVVATVGRGNTFGHPHQEVQERIKESGAQLLRTDRDGTVTFEYHGTSFQLVR